MSAPLAPKPRNLELTLHSAAYTRQLDKAWGALLLWCTRQRRSTPHECTPSELRQLLVDYVQMLFDNWRPLSAAKLPILNVQKNVLKSEFYFQKRSKKLRGNKFASKMYLVYFQTTQRFNFPCCIKKGKYSPL